MSNKLEMPKCVHCKGRLYVEGLVCSWCKGLGAKREIYDREEGPRDPSSFSDLYLGHSNYKKIRKKNIEE